MPRPYKDQMNITMKKILCPACGHPFSADHECRVAGEAADMDYAILDAPGPYRGRDADIFSVRVYARLMALNSTEAPGL